MGNKPLVSFLIAAYNEEKYIIDCIESCLNQTYTNIEVCFTDDGSSDNTLEIVQERYKDNKRVKIDTLGKNAGKIFAFNRSYMMASGDFFALIGADDVNLDYRIEKSLQFLIENKFDLMWGNLVYVNEKLEKIKESSFDFYSRKISVENILFQNFVCGTTVFFNKNIANIAFPIPDTLKFEDWWIGFNAILLYNVGFSKEVMTKYRQHRGNSISNMDLRTKNESTKKDFMRHFSYYREFERVIRENYSLKRKRKYLKIIKLSEIYKKNIIEESFFKRILSIKNIARNFLVHKVFFVSLLTVLVGQELLNFKRKGK